MYAGIKLNWFSYQI